MTETYAAHEAIKHPDSRLFKQLAGTISLRDQLLRSRFPALENNSSVLEREMRYLTDFYTVALQERTDRAGDVESAEVQEANTIAERVLCFTPYRTGCVDGRNKMVYVFGIPPGIGGDYRIPAGDPKEFVQKRGGGLKLLPGTNYEASLNGMLGQNNTGKRKTIIWDSHLKCAAQKLSVDAIKPSYLFARYQDGGLFEDVMRKRDIVNAVIEYVNDFDSGDQIGNMQISYNPENNFLYMGLERDAVLQFAGLRGGFTDRNLSALVTQGGVISTQKLVDDPNIARVFRDHSFDPNWKTDYKATCLQFWQNIENISKTHVVNIIRDQVRALYPDSSDDHIEARTQTLLLNAYSGYLNNRADKVASAHIENIVVVTEREYGPFDKVSGFQVARTSGDIPGDTFLATGIIAQNRVGDQNGPGISDITGIYNSAEYINAPTSILVQVIDRNDLSDWNQIGSETFADLATRDWLHMGEHELSNYLREKNPAISAAAVELVWRLKRKAAAFYDPYSPTKRSFSKGAFHALYTVADRNRRPLAIVPFEFAGY